MRFSYVLKGRNHDVDLEKVPGGYRASMGGQSYSVQVNVSIDGALHVLIDGKLVTAFLATQSSQRYVWVNGKSFSFEKLSAGARSLRTSDEVAEEILRAPMPGQVRQVLVREGARVERGQTLLLLEAMKMEIRIQASRDGTVAKLHVGEGASVEKDAVLVEMERETA